MKRKQGVKMDPDFNEELLGYAEESKVMAKLADVMRREKSRIKRAGGDLIRPMPFDEVGRAVFESLVIFLSICPRQALVLLRTDLPAQLHEFHSAQTRKFLRAKRNALQDMDVRSLQSRCLLMLVQQGVDKDVDEELEGRKAMWEAKLLAKETKVPKPVKPGVNKSSKLRL